MANKFRVELTNVQTVGARCGYGEGKTLKEAQEDAFRHLNTYYPGCDGWLSASGYQLYFNGGINC